ncbi:hypothetical protein IBL38_25380 [Pseudomonas syringae pv. syringae]|uniref:tetratricopeptide repeat protein n=1 Tax=Pseudomonas syringae TaxID=317 RepID=UPI001659E03F|nr:hypothetical protein [Pseudomonas syringae]MBC9745629.1 hypothetical protein [Pseudomonas syringae pv. syringae]MBC9750628.1 hypothetical protein [Pseudomonas syringae pv. syringae]
MSFSTEESDRKVIPIWDPSKLASSLAENTAIRLPAHRTTAVSESARLMSEFAQSQQVGTAVELLNSAKLENNHEGVAIASRQILEDGSLPAPVIELARSAILQEQDSPALADSHARIAALRNGLRASPQNTLAWVDMAREYISLGQSEPAERAMTIALGLTPNHRWVSRVASRLYVHLGDFDKAHHVLARHPALKSDPWIASAEISVAQLRGKTSSNLSAAKRIQELGLHPKHTTELTSSLGTLEIESGAIKRAKMYIRSSLQHANRNTLAQALWAEQKHDIKSASHSQIQSLEIAYEAKARESYLKGEADPSIRHALEWFEAEPFSVKPPVLASYIASLDDRYEQILDITRRGLIANPNNAILKLNRAYAELGLITPLQPTDCDNAKVAGWRGLFDEELREGGPHHAQALANYGMLCYRVGALEYGRKYYEAAEKVCQKESYRHPVLCTIYHAREAILAKAEWAPIILERARLLTSKTSDIGSLEGVDSLKKVELLYSNPENYRAIFKIPGPDRKVSNSALHLDFADSIDSGLTFHLPDDFKRR